MYYQNYEDYMRSVLGYPMDMQNTYQENYFNESRTDDNLEDLYPEIFKVINPLIVDVCDKNNRAITKNILEDMVEEVYAKVENNDVIININVVNNSEITSKEAQNRSTADSSIIQNNSRLNYNRNIVQNQEQLKKDLEIRENRENKENRQIRPNNPFLKDLIRILILNRLIGNRPYRPQMPRPRPPYPANMRPPMPPPPGRRDEYDSYLRF